MSNRQYTDAIETIADLQTRGYDCDFTLAGDQLRCSQQKIMLKTAEFEILEMYYFPGNRREYNERMVYAIGAPDYGIKGILLITGIGNSSAFPHVINRILQKGFTKNSMMAAHGIL